MHFRHFIFLFFTVFTIQDIYGQLCKFSFQRAKMGSTFTITVFSDDSIRLSKTVELVFKRADILNQIFSDYLENSEINMICKAAKLNIEYPVSEHLYHILKISKEAYDASHGAFDITIAPIVQLWRKARRDKILPDKKILKSTLFKVGFNKINVDKTFKISFLTEGVRLDFGGIVKGYAAQEAVNILKENGFPVCLVDAGGDLVMGSPPVSPPALKGELNNSVGIAKNSTLGAGVKTEGWRIGISIPNSENDIIPQFLFLKNQAVATSGDLYQGVEMNGKTYSHIVNPKTGLGVTHRRNVTVIAPDGAQADWLATACSILSIKKAMKLVKKYPNVELLILENRNGKIKQWQSSGFSRYFSDN
jgi:thiamine biosynthesis lipoprotein